MDIPRITVDEVKAKMDRGESMIILDVRQPGAYSSSPRKIPGASYVDPNDEQALAAFARPLDKKTPIVTY